MKKLLLKSLLLLPLLWILGGLLPLKGFCPPDKSGRTDLLDLGGFLSFVPYYYSFREGVKLPLRGQGGFTDSLLCRTWQVDWAATYSHLSPTAQQKYLALPTAQQNNLQSSMASRVYTFHTDGTLTLQWQTGTSTPNQTMTWQRTNNTLLLTLNGQQKQFDLSQLTTTVLVLTSSDPNTLFSELHLKPKP